MKAILLNVTAIISQGPTQQHPGMPGRGNPNGGPGPNRPQDGGNGSADTSEQSPEELDAARTREITSKAVTGIILLLLKWFKVSRTSNSAHA
jgi:hypothetical protein